MQALMLDTNVFNDLVDMKVPGELLADFRLVATHIQVDEIMQTSDEARRRRLKDMVFETVDEFQPTSSAVFDVSRWDQASWGDKARFNRMLRRLVELDMKSGKKLRPPNQQRDILIAETALCHDCTFVSRDSNLIAVVLEEGGMALSTTQPSPPRR